jgi:hypothetical protein
MYRILILSFSLSLILHHPLQAAGGNGPLWEKRAESATPEDEKFEPSLVPAVLGGAAGGVMGIELGVVGVGVAAGSTASWWLLGGVGLVVGAVAGAWTGDYYFNRPKVKAVAQPDAAGTKTAVVP